MLMKRAPLLFEHLNTDNSQDNQICQESEEQDDEYYMPDSRILSSSRSIEL